MAADRARRKRLGQYFTGVRLAKALAALCDAPSACSILDPMAGSGDMFVACSQIGAAPSLIGGIELDPAAAILCGRRSEGLAADVRIVTGSAFDERTWQTLPDAWDLVIANPPYVRYQAQSETSIGQVAVPSAQEVRAGLSALLERSNALTECERELFVRIARSYSGLSDLAVPSWLLCASRVRQGGRLGIVVPDTWLSRDYAAPILYVLRRLFDTECVIVDSEACWFEESLVRTTLIVARRVEDKMSARMLGGHLVVRVPRAAGTPQSVIGAAFSEDDPETALARWVRSGSHPTRSPLQSRWSNESDLVELLHSTQPRWLDPGERMHASEKRLLPEAVRAVVGTCQQAELTNLAGLGWAVGQGLRTGANKFFYVDLVGDGRCRSALLPDEPLTLPSQTIRPAVRRQSELPKSTGLAAQPLSAVLVLEGWALPSDIGPDDADKMRPADGDLARLIIAGATAHRNAAGTHTPLPELSAVKTNVRPGRCWYHLPPFTKRHLPDLFVPRVNARKPRVYLNGCDEASGTARRYVIDANFSTLWSDPSLRAPLDRFALSALLSSSWAAAVLETTGTVMGGGALKVEATHLRRMLLPKPRIEAEAALIECGHRLASEGSSLAVVDAVDQVVGEFIGLTARATRELRRLHRKP